MESSAVNVAAPAAPLVASNVSLPVVPTKAEPLSIPVVSGQVRAFKNLFCDKYLASSLRKFESITHDKTLFYSFPDLF